MAITVETGNFLLEDAIEVEQILDERALLGKVFIVEASVGRGGPEIFPAKLSSLVPLPDKDGMALASNLSRKAADIIGGGEEKVFTIPASARREKREPLSVTRNNINNP